jgi:MFS family permease
LAAAPTGPNPTARQEWAHSWPAMVACMSGMLLSSLPTYAFGLFIQPLQDTFGWNRSEISSGLSVVSVLSLIVFPLTGKLVDRYGVRAVALPGALLNGALLGVIGLINTGSMLVWWLSWALFTFGFAMVNPTVWAKAISRRFKAGQGLAIGVLMCGSAFATLTIPSLTRWAIDEFGWRLGFVVAGMVPSAVTFVLVALTIRQNYQAVAVDDAPPLADAAVLPGYTFAEAIRRPAIIKLLLAVLLAMTITVANLVHMVPILAERGLDRTAAAAAVSIYGIGSIGSKLTCGWLTDRGINTRWLGVFAFSAFWVACGLLTMRDPGFTIASVALVFFGITAGAVLQLSAYLTIRYAGLRAFGQVYGLCAGLMSISGGFGPLLAGVIFDLTGNYTALMLVGLPVAAVTALLMATLGPQPVFAAPEPARAA